MITSFIDGSEIRYIDSKQRFRLILQSAMAISALVLLVVCVVVGIYLMRFYLSVDEGGPLSVSSAQTLASVMNAVQIQVMNYIYSFLANALSERENHRYVIHSSVYIYDLFCFLFDFSPTMPTGVFRVFCSFPKTFCMCT